MMFTFGKQRILTKTKRNYILRNICVHDAPCWDPNVLNATCTNCYCERVFVSSAKLQLPPLSVRWLEQGIRLQTWHWKFISRYPNASTSKELRMSSTVRSEWLVRGLGVKVFIIENEVTLLLSMQLPCVFSHTTVIEASKSVQIPPKDTVHQKRRDMRSCGCVMCAVTSSLLATLLLVVNSNND